MNQTDTPAQPIAPVAEPRTSILTDVRNVWWRETLTVLRDWRSSRAWLARELDSQPPER